MKSEEKLKNLFVKHLKEKEEEKYETIDENVKSKSGNTDFDYLLESGAKKLLALEITQINDRDFEIIVNKSRVLIDFLQKLHSENQKNLPHILVKYPLSPVFERVSVRRLKNILKRNEDYIRTKFTEVLGKEEKVSFWIPEEAYYPLKDRYLCNIEFESIEGQSGISFFGEGMEIFNTIDFETEETLKELKRLISHKNQQLEYDADRKILLIQDSRRFKFNSTIKRALDIFANTNSREMCNIDEVFIAFSENRKISFQQVYRN